MKKFTVLFMMALMAMTFLTSCGGTEKKIANIESDGIDLVISEIQFNMPVPKSFSMYSLEITDTLNNENVFTEFSDVEKVALSTALNTKFMKVHIKYRYCNEQRGTSIGTANAIISDNNLGALIQSGDNKTVRYMITGTTDKPKEKKNNKAGENSNTASNVEGGDYSAQDMYIDPEEMETDIQEVLANAY